MTAPGGPGEPDAQPDWVQRKLGSLAARVEQHRKAIGRLLAEIRAITGGSSGNGKETQKVANRSWADEEE